MKLTRLLLLFALTFLFSAATMAVTPIESTADTYVSVSGEKSVVVTTAEFSTMKARDLKEKMGRKLKFKERIAFGFAKRKIRKAIKKDKLNGEEKIDATQAIAMNWGAFVLGFLLGIIGIAIVLLFFDDEEAWKSALIGMAAWLVILLLII